jgi:hypothetical protein
VPPGRFCTGGDPAGYGCLPSPYSLGHGGRDPQGAGGGWLYEAVSSQIFLAQSRFQVMPAISATPAARPRPLVRRTRQAWRLAAWMWTPRPAPPRARVGSVAVFRADLKARIVFGAWRLRWVRPCPAIIALRGQVSAGAWRIPPRPISPPAYQSATAGVGLAGSSHFLPDPSCAIWKWRQGRHFMRWPGEPIRHRRLRSAAGGSIARRNGLAPLGIGRDVADIRGPAGRST